MPSNISDLKHLSLQPEIDLPTEHVQQAKSIKTSGYFRSHSGIRKCKKETFIKLHQNKESKPRQSIFAFCQSALSRSIKTMATNGYYNSLRLLNCLKPLNNMIELSPVLTGLTCFNFVTGCCATALDKPSRFPSEKFEYCFSELYHWEFKCGDTGQCFHYRHHCDGVPQCPDGSDEQHCPECPEYYAKCNNAPNAPCIHPNYLCDGINDCSNGSDEHNCETLPTTLSPGTSCLANQFNCNEDSGKKCIPLSWVCDDDYDCSNNSDEQNCKCKWDEFHCREFNPNYECIPQRWLCDGEIDCADASDEQNCNTSDPLACEPDEFSCNDDDEHIRCIHETKVCDKHRTHGCISDSDERYCYLPGYINATTTKLTPPITESTHTNPEHELSTEFLSTLSTQKLTTPPEPSSEFLSALTTQTLTTPPEPSSEFLSALTTQTLTTTSEPSTEFLSALTTQTLTTPPEPSSEFLSALTTQTLTTTSEPSTEFLSALTTQTLTTPPEPSSEFLSALTTQTLTTTSEPSTEFLPSFSAESPTTLMTRQTTNQAPLTSAFATTDSTATSQKASLMPEISSTSAWQPFWTSLTDHTTYKSEEIDSNGINKEENHMLAAGLTVGVSAVMSSVVLGLSLWNAVKRREKGRIDGQPIGWRSALWGGLKDTACLKVRKSAPPTDDTVNLLLHDVLALSADHDQMPAEKEQSTSKKSGTKSQSSFKYQRFDDTEKDQKASFYSQTLLESESDDSPLISTYL